MDALPPEYVQQNVPLIFISGLSQDPNCIDDGTDAAKSESGTKITTGSPECSGDSAKALRSELLKHDSNDGSWKASSTAESSNSGKYRMRTIGRGFRLPPRKAAPVAISPGTEHGASMPSGQSSTSLALHSPLSPLSPGSPIYPDGLMTPLWFRKHQFQVPAAIIACFQMTTDNTASSMDQAQSDIHVIRNSLSRSGFKTRLAVLILGNESAIDASELEARLVIMRRATSMDAKTLFFVPSGLSPDDLTTLVQNVLSTLHPACIDYYRDLTKHARRKKTRIGTASSVSSPIGGGGSLSLSTSGWNVRYDIKQGVFAEYRAEMDSAERHYSSAIEELFKEDGLLETTPSWAPRWNDARLICDALAVRVIRCQLLTNSTTGAAQSWSNYQARMKDLIDRRGKGSDTYGWATWEARWASIMAELTRTAQPLAFPFAVSQSVTNRLPPFHHLHGSGHWWRLALEKTRLRRTRALQIPEEDRISPSQIPASAAANRNRNYDLYLALQPHEELPLTNETGYDYLNDLNRIATEAITDLQQSGQQRAAEQVQLELGKDFAAAERYLEAITYLKPLWQNASWRHDDWSGPLEEVLGLLSRCARSQGDAELILATTWEGLSVNALSAMNVVDVSTCLKDVAADRGKIRLQTEASNLRGPLQPSFAFESSTGCVGEPLLCQLKILSVAPLASAPIALTQICVNFSGDRMVIIHHKDEGSVGKEDIVLSNLRPANSATVGVIEYYADLRITAQKARIYGFDLECREPGLLTVENVVMSLDTSNFSLEHTYSLPHIEPSSFFFFEDGPQLRRKPLASSESIMVTILPKPPKLQVLLHDVRKHYYTDECVQLTVEFLNEESDAIDATAKVMLIDQAGNGIPVRWENSSSNEVELELPNIAAEASHQSDLLWTGPTEPGDLTLIIEVNYVLCSDRNTPLFKSRTLEMRYTVPFDARFDFGPQYHDASWPSFFDPTREGQPNIADGIIHQWRVSCRLQYLALDTLDIQNMTLKLNETTNDAVCEILPSRHPNPNTTLAEAATTKRDFFFTTQKTSLDDRRPSVLEFALEVAWSREGKSATSLTTLVVPRLTLPSSEPRVLLTIDTEKPQEVDVVLNYHLENPSLHFLTFALTMEASDEFAFAGSKYRQLSLAPLSRICIDYGLLLHKREDSAESEEPNVSQHSIRPVLQVLDSYYQKNLRTHPGGPGVSSDEHGIVVQIPSKD